MIESRCGLLCNHLNCKELYNCSCAGCLNADQPFHGRCPVKDCCEQKGLSHCGQCDVMPCEKLYQYSYLDPEHGDKPQGARVDVCRKWAAEDGIAWHNVLLTSAGWEDMDGNTNKNIRDRFLSMLGKPADSARVLFIPTAAINGEQKYFVGLCKNELRNAGISEDHITVHEIDGSLSLAKAMTYDAVYFTGGDTGNLLSRIKETGFDKIIKKMVFANKVYVGVSAGSLIATPNIGDPYEEETAGLCFIHSYLSVHCPPGTQPRTGLPLPHIPLADNQAVAAGSTGWEII